MAGVASDRFASLNCDDLDKILTEKDSKNTKRTTDVAVKIFKTYLREKELPENFEEASASSLDDQLTRFYAEVRQVNGQKYKTTTLTAVRHGINRYLQLKTAGMDIINGGDFKKSKQMFAAVTKDLKREGKGGITHYPPIETCDLQKMYEYFDLESNVKLQQKVLVDIMMYFGRRENLHLLKISDFAVTTDTTGHLFIFMPNDELTKNHQDNPNTAEGRIYARKGAFLIPYLICVLIGGIPMFYLEVAVGQFMGVAGPQAWNLVPIFRGIGLSTMIIVFFLNCYYNVILTWSFRYFFASFTSELPWRYCDREDWATDHCFEFNEEQPVDNRCDYVEMLPDRNITTVGALVKDECINEGMANLLNITIFNSSGTEKPILDYYVEPVVEYWENKVLAISDGIDQMGPPKWDMALCLLLAWIVVYLCICKGIRSSGKVMYFTATSPYIFMTILLIRNCLLEGSREGIIYYLKPDFEKMGEMQVWVDAGTQIFFSYSISLGALTALGSYNKFNHNSYRDSILFAITNSGTSIFAGFIIFSILGHMAHVQGKDIADVAESGPGLAFIAYPKALTMMPAAPFWSVCFFLMLILLGLDSQFVGVEGVITPIVDQFPGFLRKGYRREVFIAVVCILQFLVGLPMICPGGMYVFQLFDYYSGSRIILFVAAFMCVTVAWIYGVRRFYDNIEMMYGWRINPYMGIGWSFFSPIFCMAIFVMSTINYSELDYKRPKGVYSYPNWAVAVGWIMAAFAAMWIPIGWIYHIIRYGRDWDTFKRTFKPMGFKPHQMRPKDYGEKTLDTVIRPAQAYTTEAPPPYNGRLEINVGKEPQAVENLAYQTDEKGEGLYPSTTHL